MAGAEKKTGSSSAGLRFLSLVAALTPAPAFAGAWIAPEGGQEIWSNAVGERNELNFYETTGYWEVPVSTESSVVAAPWFESNYDTIEGWRAEAVIGLKHAFYRSDDAVVAAQVGALWISHPNDDACSEGGIEARFLGGHGYGETGFFNAEVAARVLEGGCEGGRLDLTAGYRPRENWLAMAQIFVDAPQQGEQSVKAQLTLVRFGRSGRGIQIGLRARVDGGATEPALVVGLWGRPGD